MLNLKERMAPIQKYYDDRKLSYRIPENKPPDISYMSIGDAKGKIHAMVMPLGLPIISGLHQNSVVAKNFLANFVLLEATVSDRCFTETDWNPWSTSQCTFADGMQPAVWCLRGTRTNRKRELLCQ